MSAGSRALEQLGEVLVDHAAEATQPRPGTVVALPLELIIEPPREHRIRDSRDDPALEGLVESLRQHGLLHPVSVRPLLGGGFELVYCGRRVAAARRLGWTAIQACLHLDMTDEPALVAGVVENVHRRDLTGRERAHVLRLLAGIHVPGARPCGRGAG